MIIFKLYFHLKILSDIKNGGTYCCINFINKFEFLNYSDIMSGSTEFSESQLIKTEHDISADELALVPLSEVASLSPDDDDEMLEDQQMVANVNSVDDDNEYAKDEPDPDTIKMFVGQVPKSWDEKRLRKLFHRYGRVHTLNVLRDKVTSISRGKF